MKATALLLLLTITVLATSTIPVTPNASAQFNSVSPPLSVMSTINSVPDFDAYGTSGSFILRMTPQGGNLTNGPYNTPLMPWGYVTAKWAIGMVYIVFLANVTETDFTIAFLYLTNSTEPFILRVYRYGDDSLNLMTFDGSEHVYDRMVTTGSVPMPRLRIQAQRKISSNTLCAVGPDIYVDRNFGEIVNGLGSLNVFPLRNQYFSDPSAYNELWSLLTDDGGHYYFAILYMRNNDTDHVILEHQIRLNDYKAISGNTFDAKWSRFPSSVTLRLPTSNVTVNVDGFPFQTDKRGIASMNLPLGSLVIQVPSEIYSSTGGRLRFSSWGKFGKANPLHLTLNSSLDLTADYTAEYQLTVQTQFGDAQGAGWYTAGTNATFSVPSQVSVSNDTRHVFSKWGGDYNSTSNQGWVILSSPKKVQAYWVTQFKVSFQLQGAPPNSTVDVAADGKPIQVEGFASEESWVDQDSVLTIQVQTIRLQDATANYNFTGILANNEPSDGSIIVKRPTNITLIYSANAKIQSTINLSVDPSPGVEGYPVRIVGSVTPPGGSANVRLSYSTDNANWTQMVEVAPGTNGGFTYAWTASNSGTYFIKANWPGDNQYASASQVVSVNIAQAPFSNLNHLKMFSNITHRLVDEARTVPALSALIQFASSLVLLGFLIGTVIVPGGSTLLGYLIASLLVGFVLIFPAATTILAVKAAKNHRAPSLLWLSPLALIWLTALGLFFTRSFTVSPLLNEAAGILLVSSNALMLPLTVSVLVAKGVSG